MNQATAAAAREPPRHLAAQNQNLSKAYGKGTPDFKIRPLDGYPTFQAGKGKAANYGKGALAKGSSVYVTSSNNMGISSGYPKGQTVAGRPPYLAQGSLHNSKPSMEALPSGSDHSGSLVNNRSRTNSIDSAKLRQEHNPPSPQPTKHSSSTAHSASPGITRAEARKVAGGKLPNFASAQSSSTFHVPPNVASMQTGVSNESNSTSHAPAPAFQVHLQNQSHSKSLSLPSQYAHPKSEFSSKFDIIGSPKGALSPVREGSSEGSPSRRAMSPDLRSATRHTPISIVTFTPRTQFHKHFLVVSHKACVIIERFAIFSATF